LFPVICSIARTPIGKFNGVFGDLTAVDLGGVAIGAALQRAAVPAASLDGVIFGHVIRAGQGQNTARQAAHRAGVPLTVPAVTVDKVCLSGMAAIADAARRIRLGEATVLVAGGMESMTNAPHLLPGARRGYRLGDATLVDALLHDGLWCAFDNCTMGESSDATGRRLGIGRDEQDAWAVESHRRAHAATTAGAFDDEIAPVAVPRRRGEPVPVTTDEGIRPDTTVEAMAALRPAFGADGTITAANASQVSDGAAALVVADADAAAEAGMPIVAEIVSHGETAGPDASLYERPAEALLVALDRAGLSPGDLALVEINEAFASVALWSARMLGLPHEKVNVNGGAVALGHPLGATGARIVVTLVNALRKRGGGLGAATLCGGGGQGDALVVRVPPSRA
jgi:acetyl-CoA C-acetyltransferase